jgi:hypothetical protein
MERTAPQVNYVDVDPHGIICSMRATEFSWHPILPLFLGNAGLHLKRGGNAGAIYAAVTVMEGEPWLAILNLHLPTTKLRSVPCDCEAHAIDVVEAWLEGLLAHDCGSISP